MPLVVAEHHHDPEAGVFRLVIGERVEHEQLVTDEDGNVVLDDADQPTTETVAEIVPITDVVFADDAAGGAEGAADEIAAEQRELVADALRTAEPEPEPQAAPSTTQLPGVGEVLHETEE
jgi:hypothetical protein